MDTDLNSRRIQIRDDIIRIEGAMDELRAIVNQRLMITNRTDINLTQSEEPLIQSFNSMIGEKALLCHRMHSSYVERIGETLLMIQSIKERIDVDLTQWKRQQQQHRLGIGLSTDVIRNLKQIQPYYEMLTQTIYEVKTALVKLADIHRYYKVFQLN